MNITGKILILEDDLAIATLLARKVAQCGFLPSIASDSKTALESLSCDVFDAMILDYNISEGSFTGVDFYEKIKEHGIFIPAFLVTGLENPEVLLRAIRAGVRDFIPKKDGFLDDIEPALNRMLAQSKIEKDAFAAKILRDKNKILESVIIATEMCYVTYFPSSSSLSEWGGDLQTVFGLEEIINVKSISDLFEEVLDEDMAEFESLLSKANNECSSFSHHFRFYKNSSKWFLVQGRCFPSTEYEPKAMILTFFDVTTSRTMQIDLLQSNIRMEAINKRLQLGSVEGHHRIKNNLQQISSLLNLQIRKNGVLNEDEVKKLTSLIQGLAKVHDLLTTQEDGDCSLVDVKPIIEEIIQTVETSIPFRALISKIESNFLPTKIVSTLSVIVCELISNAIKYGNGEIEVNLSKSYNDIKLTVVNQGPEFPTNMDDRISTRLGLSIVNSLAIGDLGAKPVFSNLPDGRVQATITFQIPEIETEMVDVSNEDKKVNAGSITDSFSRIH